MLLNYPALPVQGAGIFAVDLSNTLETDVSLQVTYSVRAKVILLLLTFVRVCIWSAKGALMPSAGSNAAYLHTHTPPGSGPCSLVLQTAAVQKSLASLPRSPLFVCSFVLVLGGCLVLPKAVQRSPPQVHPKLGLPTWKVCGLLPFCC